MKNSVLSGQMETNYKEGLLPVSCFGFNLCVCMFGSYVCICTMRMQSSRRAEDDISFSGTGVMEDGELPCGCWE